MGEPRIKAGIWVSAVLRMGNVEGKTGMVVRKGDADAGGVLVILRGRAGNVVLTQFRDMAGELAWMRGTGAVPVGEETTDAYVGKQVSYDPDLWVIEFEALDYLPPFEGKIV
ncbi:MAG: hypothetical protein B7X08_02410 [Acidocella sp. 20-63-7]|nr:MAG: hypothetical protein B7X08_02410 [Acidocella sp. 20-63-7]HQT46891.1 DUF1491 family protein [Acidocella sp.]